MPTSYRPHSDNGATYRSGTIIYFAGAFFKGSNLHDYITIYRHGVVQEYKTVATPYFLSTRDDSNAMENTRRQFYSDGKFDDCALCCLSQYRSCESCVQTIDCPLKVRATINNKVL